MKMRHAIIKPARIEMLPLIDIVFLLLVFFIYAMLSMAVHHSLPVELPSSMAAEVNIEDNVAVTVQSNAGVVDLSIDGKPITLSDLTMKLQELSHGDTNCQVQIFGDKDVSYQQLFQVFDHVNAAGLHNISLVAEEPVRQ